MADATSVAKRNNEDFLGKEKVGKLILRFALPAIVANLVNALYNIVDQIFIGKGVGMLGNAATNVAFPLNTITSSLALLIGVGCASNFNLRMGEGNKKRAAQVAATGLGLMAIGGVVLASLSLIFLDPLLKIFGATPDVMPYAVTYTKITSLGIPFVVFSVGCGQLIRADGSPTYSMASMLTGAIANTILDPLFIFTFNMGIAGGAWATVIGQVMSGIMGIIYMPRFKTVKLQAKDMVPNWDKTKMIISLGAASCINQLAMTAVQITLNNTLTFYGASSAYGMEIPLAAVGVISKLNVVMVSIVVGIAQGCQPINGYNYGAKNFDRVRETYLKAIVAATSVSIVAFAIFQLFPRPILSIFGSGSEKYFEFAIRYLRIYMFMTFINGIQPVTSNFFTSIGKAKRGIAISLTRQILFLIPLLLVLPRFMGINGVMYAGPISDIVAALLAITFVVIEMRELTSLQKEQEQLRGISI